MKRYKRYLRVVFRIICISIVCLIVCLGTLIAVVDGNATSSWFHHSLSESLRGPRIQLRGASWLWMFRHPLLAVTQIQNPPNGATISPAFLNGMCMADQQKASDAGLKIAACIALQPTAGGVVDARGITGNQTISSTVNLAFSGELLLGAATYTATACPAFLENTAGLYWHGLAPGHPQNTDPGQATKIVSGVGGCTSLVKQQIGAGIRDVRMADITLDGNSKQATAGIEIGTSQDNRVYYERIGFTGLVNGVITDSDSTHSVQDLFFYNLHMQNVTTCLNFGQAALNNVVVMASRMTCDNQGFIVGSDDAVAGNTSLGIQFVVDDIETQPSSTTCVNVGVVRNVNLFVWDIGWAEQGNGATCSGTDVVQFGTASSAPLNPALLYVHGTANSNATTTHAVGVVAATDPNIEGIQFQAISGTLVRSASTTTAGRLVGSFGGAAGIPIDVQTGWKQIDGNTTPANDKELFPLGVQVLAGQLYQISSDTGISRIAGGQFAFGNGTQGDSSAFLYAARHLIANNIQFQSNTFRFGSSGVLGWASVADGENNAADSGLSRTGVATVCLGNGTASNCTGTFGAAKFQPANITTVAGGAPAIVYNTASSSVNANITATTMVTAPATNANCPSGLTANCSVYEINWYIDLSAVGTSCTGSTTVVLNFLYTDPLGAGQQTVATSTITIATNGNGTAGTLVANGTQIVVAKLSTTVQYSTTSFTAGTGCSPAPKYQVTPVVKQLS